MKAMMDQNLQRKKEVLDDAKDRKDTEGFWSIWSDAVDNAYVDFLDVVSKRGEKVERESGVEASPESPAPKS